MINFCLRVFQKYDTYLYPSNFTVSQKNYEPLKRHTDFSSSKLLKFAFSTSSVSPGEPTQSGSVSPRERYGNVGVVNIYSW